MSIRDQDQSTDNALQKEVVKEAIKEWLNEKVTEFGWFSLRTIGYTLLAGLAYAWFSTHGWSISR